MVDGSYLTDAKKTASSMSGKLSLFLLEHIPISAAHNMIALLIKWNGINLHAYVRIVMLYETGTCPVRWERAAI
jgi:hypothetical protein